MSAAPDRARTLLVSFAIVAVVASLASYFAWRAGEQNKDVAPTTR